MKHFVPKSHHASLRGSLDSVLGAAWIEVEAGCVFHLHNYKHKYQVYFIDLSNE